MDLTLLSLILPLVAAIVTAPLSSWLTAKLLREKHNIEVDQLKAQVLALKADTKGDELKNVREGASILMEEIVEPIKKEINAVRRELARFRKAVEKGTSCKHYSVCPIIHELQRSEEFASSKQRDDRHDHCGRDPT